MLLFIRPQWYIIIIISISFLKKKRRRKDQNKTTTTNSVNLKTVHSSTSVYHFLRIKKDKNKLQKRLCFSLIFSIKTVCFHSAFAVNKTSSILPAGQESVREQHLTNQEMLEWAEGLYSSPLENSHHILRQSGVNCEYQTLPAPSAIWFLLAMH